MVEKRPNELRLLGYVVIGGLLGLAYVVFDVLSESRLQSGTLTGTMASVHAVVDHVFPILVGILLGVSWHYLRVRGQLAAAEEAASRADTLRDRLQKVERDQAVWVLAAAVLHELNNPLHALCLLLDELDRAGVDESERRALIARARAQADRALSKLAVLRAMPSSGEPELQGVALDRLVARLADDLEPLAKENGLVVRMDCRAPVIATADPSYVRTILENLLDNSLHSLRTQGGSTVTVELVSASERAVVRVCDDGPPLPASVRSSLFEPLRSTKAQGLGLGLPIARALARAMKGDLWIDDGERTAFHLELPLRGEP
ncbi:MAG TPA: HAMP domain-containing sensor histidine kinase [Polyangiaceae bacterium]